MNSQPQTLSSQPWQLLMLSAKSEAALESLTGNLIRFLRPSGAGTMHDVGRKGAGLADVSFTLLAGRELLDLRKALVCRDAEDAIRVLQGYHPHRLINATSAARNRQVAFSFTDRDLSGMEKASALYASQPVFRAEVDRCAGLMDGGPASGWQGLFFSEASSRSAAEASLEQPARFVFGYALAKLWMSWGVRPDALIGEGIGECVAAHLAGCLSLEDALYLAALRGRILQHGRTDAAEEPASRIAAMSVSPARIPYVSGITGDWIGAEDIRHAEYWLALAHRPDGGVQAARMAAENDRLVLDVGSGRVHDAAQPPAEGRAQAVHAAGTDDPAMADALCWMLNTLGTLAASGAKIDWREHFAGQAVRRIPLPTYPFEPRRHWFIGAKEAPEHAMPAFVQSPPAINGKDDADAFSEPPRNSRVEDFLIEACRDLLGIDAIGIHDNVMQLGMDSMNVMQLSMKVNKAFNLSLAPHHLFSKPNIASLAEKILSLRPELKDVKAAAPASPKPAAQPPMTKEKGSAGAAQILKYVESLSDEEVDRLLAELGV